MFELRCRDVGFDCQGVVCGHTRDDVLQQAAAHAAAVHQVTVTPELAKQVAALIREQSPGDGAASA